MKFIRVDSRNNSDYVSSKDPICKTLMETNVLSNTQKNKLINKDKDTKKETKTSLHLRAKRCVKSRTGIE